ncbi:UDP-glucose 4-epimerase GalE [Verrucomicrobiales bacterium]|jgi:UDP-glucose 4-epimerase|nr:UDP-glucose 4-epimerase GalE [Verrucomicrobiales bacterium]MDB2495837.1 UDP-glucose 4-epimerase GalE [Verrucomicrobiales bacterium]
MRVLVTGGAGYIGSVAVDSLIAEGHEVAVFDNLYMGHRAAVNEQALFVEGDLANKSEIDAVMGDFKPDSIMHFAAFSLVGESVENPYRYLGGNTLNGMNLLQSALENGVERFILSSTANLFDEPERIPISEKEKIVPGSPYGESKFFLERILHWMHVSKGLRYACLRYFNAAGCTEVRGEDHDPETHLIPLVLQVALGQREKIMIFGADYETPDGTCVRDYIHVEDLAQAHILALEALTKKEVAHYNLGNGNGFSVKDVVETVREVTGHPVPAEVAPRRAGDPAILIADSSKIREELGWQPKYPDLKPIIESAWAWHSANPEGYGDA